MPLRDSRDRDALSELLSQIPASCTADIYDWVHKGYSLKPTDVEDVQVPYPDTSSGARCAMDAAVHKHGCCWCGKFRAVGRELTDGS